LSKSLYYIPLSLDIRCKTTRNIFKMYLSTFTRLITHLDKIQFLSITMNDTVIRVRWPDKAH